MTMIASNFAIGPTIPGTTSARLSAEIAGWPLRASIGTVLTLQEGRYAVLNPDFRTLQAQADAWLAAQP